jgi:hypothetical protein
MNKKIHFDEESSKKEKSEIQDGHHCKTKVLTYEKNLEDLVFFKTTEHILS